MNKLTFDLQSTGVSMDYGQRAMKQLLDAYVYYIDLMVIKATRDAMVKNAVANPAYLDLTAYTLSASEASTKNDKLHKFMLDLNNSLLRSCARGATAYLVDMEGAAILANDPIHFTPNTNYDLYINGVVGTYKNIPVIRHNALDGMGNTGADICAFIGAIHKTPDGQVAPVVYGEYLPPLTLAA